MLIKTCALIKKQPDPPETCGRWFVAGYLVQDGDDVQELQAQFDP